LVFTTIPANADNTESDSVLNIASVSKMYVTTAAMQLVDKGLVNLDAPVTDYIPDFKMADERYKDITVRMLMNHTSGLMGSIYEGALLFDEKSSDYHDSFLNKLSKESLKSNPGSFNCYCNDGFTLLEILIERVSKMSFTDYLKEYITRKTRKTSVYPSLKKETILSRMGTLEKFAEYIAGLYDRAMEILDDCNQTK
jgi:CubicO group peptidase (beta-lactamase class C family)